MDNMEFNFGSTGDIFDGFNASLASLQKPEEDEVEKVESVDNQDDANNAVEEDINDDEGQEASTEKEGQEDVDETESGEDGNNDPEKGQEDAKDEVDVDNISYKAIADYLAEAGVLNDLDGYDGDDSPEVLEVAIKDTVEGLIESYKESIPEEGKLFLDYIEKGGDPSRFFKTLEESRDISKLDLESESVQKEVYREFLESIGFTEDEIKEEINDAEDNLLLEKKAKTAAKKLEKIYADKKKALIAEQEAYAEQVRASQEQYINNIHKTIEESSQLAGLPITPAEKKDFQRYLLQADADGITQYQREIQEDPIKTQLELAYLKFKKYDFSKVTKQVKTQEAKRIRNLIKNSDKVNSRSPQITKSKPGDLSAFKTQLF